MDGSTHLVIIVLAVIVLAQQGIIFGLVNRLVMKAGLPKLNPQDAIDTDYPAPVVPLKRPVSGSQKVGI